MRNAGVTSTRFAHYEFADRVLIKMQVEHKTINECLTELGHSKEARNAIKILRTRIGADVYKFMRQLDTDIREFRARKFRIPPVSEIPAASSK